MRELGLLPAPVYIQNIDHQLLNYLDVQFRRLEENWRVLDSSAPSGLDVPAGNVIAGTFGSNTGNGNFRFPGKTFFNDGLELASPASTPYIDFHRSADPTEATDYNVRLINESTELLRLYSVGGADWGSFRVGRAKIGAYPWNGTIAAFGNAGVMDVDSTSYAVLHESDGSLDLNSKGSAQQVRLRVNGGDKVVIATDGQRNYDWIRAMNSGVGIYFSPGGGGWFQNSGDGWIYAYQNKPVYTGDFFRAGDAYIHTWGGGGGHSICSCWGASTTKGYLTRNDGNMWAMYETQFFFRGNDGGDYFNFYRFGDVRLNVPTVAPGDPDLRIAASNQLLRNASNERFKKNIRTLPKKENPVWNIRPVLYHWKDDAREHGARFNARHPKGCPGFIAEELYEVAPDACTVDTYTGEPNGPDNWALLAYLVAAVQELKELVETK